MRIKRVFFIFLFFSITAFSDTLVTNEKCGYGFDTYEGVVKQTPFSKQNCVTISQEIDQKPKIIRIKNLKHLFKRLSILKNKQFFNNYFVKKIMDNSHINGYTLTYMIYQNVTVFKTIVQNSILDLNLTDPNFINKYGDSYIKEVKSGGEQILFLHILTTSSQEYRKIKETLKESLKDIELFKKNIKIISKKQHIVVKELFTKSLGFVPADELTSAFLSVKNFKKDIIKNAIPYKYSLKKYEDLNTTLIEKKKQKLKSAIDRFLSIRYNLNDYNYYRHNLNLFLPIDANTSRDIRKKYELNKDKIRNLLQNQALDIDLQIKSNQIKLPMRYKASHMQQTIMIKPQSITILSKRTMPKIDPKKSIKMDLQSKLDIQNHGQLLRIKNTLTYEIDNKKYTKTDIRLLFDTYVNFSGLRFKSILNDYGTAALSLTLNKYEQFIDTEGAGIIDKAECGYKITKDHKLEISCKDILYKPIKIKFAHEEDI